MDAPALPSDRPGWVWWGPTVRERSALVTLVVGMVALLCAACSPATAPGSGAGKSPSSTSAPGETAPPASGADGGGSPEPSPGAPTGADPLEGWTLEEQIGQLFMAGVDVSAQQDISWEVVPDDHVGNVFLAGRSHATPGEVATLVRSFTDMVGPDSTHGTPMLVATDQEGGAVQVLQGPGFSAIPAALEQSALSPGDLVGAARDWGDELASAGVNLNLAPVMDLVDGDPQQNPPIGVWGRHYGATVEEVVEHANAFSRGMRDAGVAVAVKHFPGLGRVAQNTDTQAGVSDTVTTRDDASVEVFARGIADGAQMVMMSTAVYERIDAGVPAAFSSVAVTGMLRGDLGFRGVVITDDLSGAAQVQAWSPGDRSVRALQAGCDIVLVSASPQQIPEMVDAVVERARADADFAAKVRASAARVLTLKAEMTPADG